MSVWEFRAAINGYAKAHSSSESNRLSESEAVALFDWIEAGNDNAAVRSTVVYDWDGTYLVPARTITFEVT